MTDLVLYEADGPIVTLTLNQPELRNPVSDDDMVDAILSALDRLDRDAEARVAILTGAGSAFSSGGNLKKMAAGEGLASAMPVQTRVNYKRGIQRLPRAFARAEVPIIAAVNGPAVGAGCDLALMCDIRIAGTSAKFAESFVKLGIVPGDGGAWLLPFVVGHARAAEMALTGDTLNADEALAFGLVSRVVPDAELLPAARAIAARIAANPTQAVRMTKRLLWEARTASLDTILDMSAGYQALAHATDDNREAMAAFLEKRAPKFSGR
jgi:enoyl-CoA hydratase/carnithine racemase